MNTLGSLTIDHVRAQFPALNQTWYGKPPLFFDGPGGAQYTRHAIDAMRQHMEKGNANLGASYFTGVHVEETMAAARYSIATMMNASPEEIVFGPTATMLMFNLSRTISRDWQPGDEIIVTRMDHYSNVSSWQQAAADKGVTVHQIGFSTDTWELNYAELEAKLSAKTKLVAFGLASNLLGTITDAKRIVEAAHTAGALTFIDAVHYAPHHLLDVQVLNCDFCVLSGYKFSGPHVSALYGKTEHLAHFKPYKVEPATHQRPFAWEQGTQSFESLAGLSAAVHYLASLAGSPADTLRAQLLTAYHYLEEYEQQLGQHYFTLANARPELRLYGKATVTGRTPTFAFRLGETDPSAFVQYCADHQCCLGNGHFYAQGVVQQLGLMDSGGVIRIGFMHYNTLAEIDQLFALIDGFLNSST